MTVDISFTFNSKPLVIEKSFNQPTNSDFPKETFKNAEINFVSKHTTNYVREIINSVVLSNKRKYVVVDVKTHNIKPGYYPCLPGWHCDTVVDPRHDSEPEIHHLFVSGTASLTEFIAHPVTLDLPELTGGIIMLQSGSLLKSFRKQLEKINPKIVSIPSATLVAYGRYDFHRGSKGKFEEKRLLIRVTESDIITPTRHELKCKVYR